MLEFGLDLMRSRKGENHFGTMHNGFSSQTDFSQLFSTLYYLLLKKRCIVVMCCLLFTFSGFETRSGFKRELEINEGHELVFIIRFTQNQIFSYTTYTSLANRRPTRQPAAA